VSDRIGVNVPGSSPERNAKTQLAFLHAITAVLVSGPTSAYAAEAGLDLVARSVSAAVTALKSSSFAHEPIFILLLQWRTIHFFHFA